MFVPTSPARVVIAVRNGLFRAALRHALDAQRDVCVVGEAVDAAELLRQVTAFDPDVVIVDAELPPQGGAPACEAVTCVSNAHTVVLAEHADDQLLLSALEAGADGFVTMDARLPEVVSGIRSVLDGHAFVPPRMLADLLRSVLHRRRQEAEVRTRYAQLTRREREVLEMLAGGQDHGAIASALVISPQTARSHIQNVLTKLGVHSRVEAASFALEHGLLPRAAGGGG
jgi:DNA-binding NarL/FixJ family response regulator